VGAAHCADRLCGAVSEADLSVRLVRHIAAHGPMTIAAFMALALHDPEVGYYATRQPLGAAGDFVTAPEISQIFGELIGVACADFWQRIGCPDPVIVAELGPGRGTLISDFMRATKEVPGFHRAIRLVLVETSPALRTEQQRHLGSFNPLWIENLSAIPDGALLLIANEFLDALPIRQLVRAGRDWAERLVAVDPRGQLCLADGPQSPALTLLALRSGRDATPGTVVEICPAASALATALADRLARSPGAAWFVDYGYAEPMSGATLAAIEEHRPVGILDRPGRADLSAHVDFAAFAAAARTAGATVHGPVAQKDFLAALGADARLASLLRHATAAQRTALESGYRRLIDPNQMGTLFKVIAITSPDQPTLAGF
jgi:NADH dehydrogenase [ubiquinone] 1 alpha subcomplex assembly factor 7